MIERTGLAITAVSARENPKAPTPIKPNLSLKSGIERTAANGKDLPVEQTRMADYLEQVEQAVGQLNDYVQNIQRDLHFSIDDDTGRTVIKVVDSQSEEVIRQIPPEEALVLARHLEQVQTGDGVIVREEA